METLRYTRLSARLRAEILEACGRPVLFALQEHMYQKSLNYFDPNDHWQIADILALSELAHRLQALSATLGKTNVSSLELARIAKGVSQDFQAVYDVAMARMTPPASIETLIKAANS